MKLRDVLRAVVLIPFAIVSWTLTIIVFIVVGIAILYGLIALAIHNYFDFGPVVIVIDLFVAIVIFIIVRRGNLRKQFKDLKDQVWYGL